MTGEKKTLIENFLSLGFLQIVSYVFPLISLPYLSRILSVEYFGLVFFAFAFIQYFIIFTDYGFELSATREIAINRHNQNNLSNIFNSVMIIKLFLLFISFIILICLILFVPKFNMNWQIFLLTFLMVVGQVFYPIWFFQGMEKMKYITFLNILSKTIFLVLIFIFVKHENDYMLVPLLNSLGFLVAGIIGFVFAIKNFKIKLYIPKINSIKKQFKQSSGFFLSRFSVTAFSNTNAFCLGLVNSNLAVAYYVAAEKISGAIKGLETPIKNSLYPYISKNKDIKTFKKIFKFAVIINFLICAFVFIFAKNIITIFYGNDLVDAYKILRIFAITILISCPSTMLGYPLLGASGYTKEANTAVITASIFHVIGLLCLYLIGKINVYSIACMVLCSEALLFLIWSYFIIKYKLLEVKKGI